MKCLKKIVAVFCIAALLVTGTAESAMAAKSASTSKIGKKTSSKTYIKSEDWPDAPSIESGAAVLMDAKTGTVLYAKNPDTLLYPASITKIMTALLTLENTDINDKMSFAKEAVQSLPYNAVTINAQKGETMKIRECLSACLIYSANDAAAGLACEVSGSLSDFAKLMNKRAKELGCKNTHFHNPHGLTDSKHWTTAYDMCLIMKACIKYKAFREIAGTKLYTLKKNNKRKKSFTFAAKHKMLFESSPYYYKYMVCGKTGYTDEARNTLITYAEKDGKQLICCTMKGGHGVCYKDTKKLFQYGFKNFSTVDASEKDSRFTTDYLGLSDNAGDSSEDLTIEVAEGSYVSLPKGVSIDQLDTEVNYLEDDKDQNFAEVTYSYEGTKVGSAKLKMLLSGKTVGLEELTEEAASTAAESQANGTTGDAGSSQSGSLGSFIDSLPGGMGTVIGIGCAVLVVLAAILIGLRKKKNKAKNL